MQFQKIWQMFDTLPSQAKQEVIDFIEFLQKRYQKSEKSKTPKKSKITDGAFVGMWANHDDIEDATRWLRDLRRREWNN